MRDDFARAGYYDRGGTAAPAPVSAGPSLEDQVKALQVGDKVRAMFNWGGSGDYAVEGLVWLGTFGGLNVGASYLASPSGAKAHHLTALEVLAPAKPAPVPFYTNAPAERLPRIGDVARGYVGTNVYVGDGWVATASRGSGREVYHPFRFDAGRLALVDPAELVEEES